MWSGLNLRANAVDSYASVADFLRSGAGETNDAVLNGNQQIQSCKYGIVLLNDRTELTLAATYAAFFANPARPAMLDALIILPPSFICRISARVECITTFASSEHCKQSDRR